MRSFLGVPILVDYVPDGSVYLTEKRAGDRSPTRTRIGRGARRFRGPRDRARSTANQRRRPDLRARRRPFSIGPGRCLARSIWGSAMLFPKPRSGSRRWPRPRRRGDADDPVLLYAAGRPRPKPERSSSRFRASFGLAVTALGGGGELVGRPRETAGDCQRAHRSGGDASRPRVVDALGAPGAGRVKRRIGSRSAARSSRGLPRNPSSSPRSLTTQLTPRPTPARSACTKTRPDAPAGTSTHPQDQPTGSQTTTNTLTHHSEHCARTHSPANPRHKRRESVVSGLVWTWPDRPDQV